MYISIIFEEVSHRYFLMFFIVTYLQLNTTKHHGFYHDHVIYEERKNVFKNFV